MTILVNLTAPAGANNAGITPALLRGPSERPTETVSLPSRVLLALGAAPVGALRQSSMVEPPPPADRLSVRLPELSGSRPSQLGPVAIARVDSGTSEVDASADAATPGFEPIGSTVARLVPRARKQLPGAMETPHSRVASLLLLSRGLRQLVNSSYASALEALFGMTQWLEETALQPPTSSSYLPEELPAQDETADFEGRGSTILPGTTQVPTVSDRVVINGLTALAAFAIARPEAKQRAKSNGGRPAVRDR